jgi:polysaccharide export outer membrane protein
MRQTEKGVVIKTFDIRNTNIINSEYYYIEPDDVIFLQPLNAQFFGVTSLWTGISTVLTTISFATGIYGILTVK